MKYDFVLFSNERYVFKMLKNTELKQNPNTGETDKTIFKSFKKITNPNYI